MLRQIIRIDQEACNGCGLCVSACHEGAIQMREGKAVLVRDDYCDGLGNCLPVCPTGAITFETREAAAFDEAAVKERMARQEGEPEEVINFSAEEVATNFPLQLQLVATNAAFFKDAHLLVAADCAAYTMKDFHQQFMQGKVTLIGCPKLDHADYAAKLTEILKNNNILSLTLVRMEVPCCGGIKRATEQALQDCGKPIPYQAFTLSTKGEVV